MLKDGYGVIMEATLCHIMDGNLLLLQLKGMGLFGEGKWNGVGGKLKANEVPREGATREALEETGLLVSKLKKHGILNFYFGLKAKPDWVVHIFSTKTFEGKLKSSEEGILRWFTFDKIPYDKMWQDDKHWLPLLLEGKQFTGNFYFNENATKLLDVNLKIKS